MLDVGIRERLERMMWGAEKRYVAARVPKSGRLMVGVRAVAECGCKFDDIINDSFLTFCSLHEVAWDMLVLLEGIEDGILGSMETVATALDDGSLLDIVKANRVAVRKVIARARSEGGNVRRGN